MWGRFNPKEKFSFFFSFHTSLKYETLLPGLPAPLVVSNYALVLYEFRFFYFCHFFVKLCCLIFAQMPIPTEKEMINFTFSFFRYFILISPQFFLNWKAASKFRYWSMYLAVENIFKATIYFFLLKLFYKNWKPIAKSLLL